MAAGREPRWVRVTFAAWTAEEFPATDPVALDTLANRFGHLLNAKVLAGLQVTEAGADPEPGTPASGEPVPWWEHAARTFNPGNQAVAARLERRQLRDGPVTLWAAALAEDGTLIAAAPLGADPEWEWRQGCLSSRLPRTALPVLHPGKVWAVWLIAVQAGAWQPVTELELPEYPELRPGEALLLSEAWVMHQFGSNGPACPGCTNPMSYTHTCGLTGG